MADAPATLLNQIWEVRTTLRFAKFKVRVWSESSTYRMGPDLRIVSVGKELERNGHAGDPSQIIQDLLRLGNIVAIEVCDPEENGVVYYPDWR